MELALRRNVSKGQMQPRRVGLFYCFANRDRTGSLQLAFVCIWHSGLRLLKTNFQHRVSTEGKLNCACDRGRGMMTTSSAA